MTKVESSVLINATADEIDAVALDPSRWHEWYAGVKSTTSDGAFPKAGGSVSMAYKSSGITFELTITSVRWAPNKYIIQRLDGMISGTNRWNYEPEDGGIRVTVKFDYDMPGGSAGKLVDKLIVERMNVKNLNASLAGLKKIVEG